MNYIANLTGIPESDGRVSGRVVDRSLRPLFEWVPDLASSLPWRALADLPTPVEKLPLASNAWIKRDDITHAEYGGNKIRKLEFIIAESLAKGARRVVTFGATGTNHGVATAMVCQGAGLACDILLFDQPDSPTVKINQALMRHYGARLIFCGSLASTVRRYYLHPGRLSGKNYFLFAGGSNVAGTLGLVNAAFELQQQVLAGDMPLPSHVVCPVGSSATLAGLTLGFQWAGLPVKVVGVRVAPAKLGPFEACTADSIYKLMRSTHHFMESATGKRLPLPVRPILVDEFYGPGYGEATAAGEAARRKFAGMGVQLEQTYSAKAAACFMELVDREPSPVLFWNTFNSRPSPL